MMYLRIYVCRLPYDCMLRYVRINVRMLLLYVWCVSVYFLCTVFMFCYACMYVVLAWYDFLYVCTSGMYGLSVMHVCIYDLLRFVMYVGYVLYVCCGCMMCIYVRYECSLGVSCMYVVCVCYLWHVCMYCMYVFVFM